MFNLAHDQLRKGFCLPRLQPASSRSLNLSGLFLIGVIQEHFLDEADVFRQLVFKVPFHGLIRCNRIDKKLMLGKELDQLLHPG